MDIIFIVLGVAIAFFAIVLAITVFTMIVVTVYCMPYFIWVGWNAGTKGIPPNSEHALAKKQKGVMWLNCKNATKRYRSWITGKPHGITKF